MSSLRVRLRPDFSLSLTCICPRGIRIGTGGQERRVFVFWFCFRLLPYTFILIMCFVLSTQGPFQRAYTIKYTLTGSCPRRTCSPRTRIDRTIARHQSFDTTILVYVRTIRQLSPQVHVRLKYFILNSVIAINIHPDIGYSGTLTQFVNFIFIHAIQA